MEASVKAILSYSGVFGASFMPAHAHFDKDGRFEPVMPKAFYLKRRSYKRWQRRR